MFSWIQSVIGGEVEEEVVTRFVAKNTGQRGPLINIIPSKNKRDSICLCVTPCSVFVFFWEAAPLGKRLSLSDDAFTCAQRFKTSALVAGTQQGQVCVVSLDDALVFTSRILRHAVVNCAVTAVATSADCTQLAAGFADGSVVLWKEEGNQEGRTLRFFETKAAVTALVFVESESAALWAGFEDGNIAVLYLDGESIGNFALLKNACRLPMTLLWHRGLDVVVVNDASKEVVVVAVSNHAVLHRYDAALVTCGAAVTCTQLLGERELLLLGATDGSFCVRELAASEKQGSRLKCQLLRVWENASPDAGPVTCVAWDADADVLLVGDAGCRVRSVSAFSHKIRLS